MIDDEEIESLEGTAPVIDRVIDDESGKTYKFKTDVFILDDAQQLIRKIKFAKCKVIYTNPVKVFNDSNTLIGSAVLDIEDNVVTAEVFLDYSTPERLNIETRSIPLYPHLESYADTFPEAQGNRATRLIVSSIILGTSPTPDTRIGPIQVN